MGGDGARRGDRRRPGAVLRNRRGSPSLCRDREMASAEGRVPAPRRREQRAAKRRDQEVSAEPAQGIFVIIGIESEPAYKNLDAILDVGGIDAVFIGPNDMSTSLGIPDDYTNKKYLRVVEDIIKRCAARKISVMVHQQTIATSTKAIKLGARFVLHSSDGRMLQRIMQEEMNALRKAAGATTSAQKDTVETV